MGQILSTAGYLEMLISEAVNSSPATQQAMNISLIMEEIFSHLHPHDFKTCRLVCHSWNNIACRLILKSNSFRVSLYCHRVNWQWTPAETEFHRHYRKNCIGLLNMTRSLQDLNDVLCNSSNFPCTDFEFVGGNLASMEVTKFFELQGPSIKTLRLDGVYHGDGAKFDQAHNSTQARYHKYALTTRERIQEILQYYTPNIQNLTLTNFKFKWPAKHDELSLALNDNVYLPNLQVYNSQCWSSADDENPASSTLFQILVGSPHLTRVDNFKVGQIQPFLMGQNKVGLIKEYEFEPTTYENLGEMALFSKFVETKPKLRKIVVKPPVLKNPAALLNFSYECTNLFELSKESLEELEFFSYDLGNFLTLTRVKYPRLGFPKLHTLNLIESSRTEIVEEREDGVGEIVENPPLFPIELNMAKTFPGLKILRIKLTRGSWNKYFSHPEVIKGALSCVKILEIFVATNVNSKDGLLVVEWIKNLKSLCPAVRNLKIGGSLNENVLELSSGLWKELEEFEIWIQKGQDFVASDLILEKFLKEKEENGGVAGIWDLKRLKRFKVLLDDVQRWSNMEKLPNFLSGLTPELMMRLGPDLKVTVAFDQTKPAAKLFAETIMSTCPPVNIVHDRVPCTCVNCSHHSSLVFNLNPRLQYRGFFSYP